MRKLSHIHHLVLVLLMSLPILVLSACGPAAVPAPTQTVQALYTAAAQTFTAQLSTQIPSTRAASTPSPAASTAAAGSGVPVTGGTAAPGATNGSGGTGGTGVPATGGGTSASSGTGTGTASGCNNAAYISDVTIPDGTVVVARTNFTKTWAIRNTGTCPWTNGYKLTFFNGESMGGTSVPLTGQVAAGASVNVSVNLTAPVLPGNYTGAWQMVDAQGNRFGQVVTVVITVSNTGGTSITATP